MAFTSDEQAKSAADMVSMGALIVAGAGVAAIVLSILGLANIAINGMLAVTTIVIGVAFILQGLEVLAEFSAAAEGDGAAVPVSGGVTMELLVGGAGIVLGILALVVVNAMYLVPAALILFGAALLLTGVSRSQSQSSSLRGEAASGTMREMARQSKLVASGAQLIVGIAAIILGVLAYVIPFYGQTLALVGLLAVGAALLLSSAAEASLAQVTVAPLRGRTATGTVRPTPGE